LSGLPIYGLLYERLLWNNNYTKHTYYIFIEVLVIQKEVCFSVGTGSQILFASATDLTLPEWSAALRASECWTEMRSGMLSSELDKWQLC